MSRRITLRQWEHRRIKRPFRLRFLERDKIPSEEYLKKVKVMAKMPVQVNFKRKDGSMAKLPAKKIEYVITINQAKYYAKLVRKEIEKRIKLSLKYSMAEVMDEDIQEWVYGK